MPSRSVALAALGAAAIACGPSKPAPRAAAPATASAMPIDDENTLTTAVAMKNSGDPVAAWKLLEALPVTSPARFDPRYTEVMSAWADARTRELGTEIAGSKGGGPTPGKVEAEEPTTLTADKIEGIVASKRTKLRDACFGDANKSTSFMLEIRIDTDGRVLQALTSDIKGETLVAQCVRTHAVAWTFPQNTEGALHRTRFMFAR